MNSIIQVLIDRSRDTSGLKLILCGSFVDVMKSLLAEENPLYGRIDLTVDLKPMDYLESSLFYPDFSPEDKVRLFSVFGGIPYYNRLIESSMIVREYKPGCFRHRSRASGAARFLRELCSDCAGRIGKTLRQKNRTDWKPQPENILRQILKNQNYRFKGSTVYNHKISCQFYSACFVQESREGFD